MIPLAALAVLLHAAAAAPCGLPPRSDAPPPFRPGESLTFDVDVMGAVRAGTISLTVEPPISRRSLLPLRARVRTTSMFAKVRRLRGYALSWIEVGTLRPQRYRDEVEENGVHKATDTRLDGEGPVQMTWVLGERRGSTSMERRGAVLDLLSTVYYLRAARLRPGAPICFDVVANRRFWSLRADVAPGKERVESGAGSFRALRVDATLSRADGGGPDRELHLWFSDDARRLPLAAVSEVDVGPVRAVLSRVGEPANEPLD